jgi:hypothetical protein
MILIFPSWLLFEADAARERGLNSSLQCSFEQRSLKKKNVGMNLEAVLSKSNLLIFFNYLNDKSGYLQHFQASIF